MCIFHNEGVSESLGAADYNRIPNNYDLKYIP